MEHQLCSGHGDECHMSSGHMSPKLPETLMVLLSEPQAGWFPPSIIFLGGWLETEELETCITYSH